MKKKHIIISTLTLLSVSILLAFVFVDREPRVNVPANMIDSVTEEEQANIQQEEKKKVLQKEREELEQARKTELDEFYVPLPPLDQNSERSTVKAKAIYLTDHVAGFGFEEADIAYYAEYIRSESGESGKPTDTSHLDQVNKLEKALAICEATEVNALVIDIKNDNGQVAWSSDIGIVNRLGSNASAPLKEYQKLMDYLEAKEIYTIARIVAFKDPLFAQKNSEHAIQLIAGGVYQDHSGMAWVNSFDDYVWKYLVAISQEAALRGFDEIQFDYVRFPDSAKYYNPITTFPGRNDRDKDEGIEQFLIYASKELAPYPVNLSADVFGIITRSWDDKPEDIGQTWRKIANQVDYICPMIYPSHYGAGQYGFAVPDQYPYEVSRLAMLEAIERNAAQKNPGVIRPWFQGFNASWVKGHIDYTPKVISDQMVAAMELGIDEYIIWNASNNYDPMSFFYQDRINQKIRKDGEDRVARTPETALVAYLTALRNQSTSILYLLTPITNRPEEYDAFATERGANVKQLKKYEILSIEQQKDGTWTAKVKEEYSQEGASGPHILKDTMYRILLENDVYKVLELK